MSEAEIPWVTAGQMAQVDQLAEAEFHLALVQMMENAGSALARLARRRFLGGSAAGRSVFVAAGAGGNGGGGLAAARRLRNWGAEVTVALAVETGRMRGVPGHQLQALLAVDVKVGANAEPPPSEADLIIDALLGYRLKGPPRGRSAELIRLINEHNAPVLSLDLPSGLHPDTGEGLEPTVRAAATMTLALPKVGMRADRSRAYVGELWLADIGIPRKLYARLGIAVPDIFAEQDILRIV